MERRSPAGVQAQPVPQIAPTGEGAQVPPPSVVRRAALGLRPVEGAARLGWRETAQQRAAPADGFGVGSSEQHLKVGRGLGLVLSAPPVQFVDQAQETPLLLIHTSDSTRAGRSSLSKEGTSDTYLLRRLKRDRPDLATALFHERPSPPLKRKPPTRDLPAHHAPSQD